MYQISNIKPVSNTGSELTLFHNSVLSYLCIVSMCVCAIPIFKKICNFNNSVTRVK